MIARNRKIINIVAGIFCSALVIAFGFSLLTGDPVLLVMGNVLLYGGVFIFIMGFVFMGSNRGLVRHETPDQYEARRKRERPLESVAVAAIVAALLISISGYVVLYFAIPRV